MNKSRAERLMSEAGVSALITSTLENGFYFSGIWNFGQELFPYGVESYVVVPAEDASAGTVVLSVGEADLILGANPTVKGLKTYGKFVRVAPEGAELTPDELLVKQLTLDTPQAKSGAHAIVDALTEKGLTGGTIGVDERGPNRTLIPALQELLPDTTFKPAADLFRSIRMVKTPAEHRRLEQTLRITESGFAASIGSIHEGVTERELQLVFEAVVTAAGAKPAFALVRFGKGIALGQVPPGDTKLQRGDTIFYDIGCTYNGYRSDIGRVVCFDAPDSRLEGLYAASKGGQERAFDTMRPGATANDVFHAAVDYIRQEIPWYERHHVGHGIGVEFYDAPVLSPGIETKLEAGMVFEVETPYYELGYGGTFIEDTVIVRDDGVEILTRIDRELQVIGA
jgi:Xaa-Pro aminopeptidase